MPSSTRSSRSKSRATRSKPLLSHRRLLLAETVLVLGLLQMLARDWVLAQPHIPAPLRVLFGMGLILGLFGGLLFFVRQQVERSLSTTHEAVQKLPLPTPMLVVHTLALAVLFWLYAHYYGLDAAVWADAQRGWDAAVAWWRGPAA